MRYLKLLTIASLIAVMSSQIFAENWRTERISPTDRLYIKNQVASISDLAGRHFGRQINGQKINDIAVMQRLLNDNIVRASDVKKLQAIGIILGVLLKAEYSLEWIIYTDSYGRSRSLKLPGFDRDFIFPATQVSRKAEVGLTVNIAKIYAILEQSITDIRNKPPF